VEVYLSNTEQIATKAFMKMSACFLAAFATFATFVTFVIFVAIFS
jgi:hypothetical protein